MSVINKPRVFIDGRAGTTGLQIVRRLRGRADIDLVVLPDDRRRDVSERTEQLNAADVVILCLPDEAAVEAVGLVTNEQARIIDTSTAHRVAAGWVYGMPEYSSYQPHLIAQATKVSNPGCYPMGSIALLAPLTRSGMLPADHLGTILGVSGYSGGGRTLIQEFEGEGESESSPFYLYGLTQSHKHLEEIRRYSLLATTPSFVPSVGRFRQGMVISIPLNSGHLTRDVTRSDIVEHLTEAYERCPFIRIADKEESGPAARIDPSVFADTDHMELAVHSDPRDERFLLTAVYDNLGKGASGTAVQNLNLMLGIHQEVGLQTAATGVGEAVAL